MRGMAEETLDEFTSWFWNNLVVNITLCGRGFAAVAPEDAKELVDDKNRLEYIYVNAIEHYEKRDLVRRLFMREDLLRYLRAYWFANYAGKTKEGQDKVSST